MFTDIFMCYRAVWSYAFTILFEVILLRQFVIFSMYLQIDTLKGVYVSGHSRSGDLMKLNYNSEW